MISVANVSPSALQYRFMIVRDCSNERYNGGHPYWFYGADNDLMKCTQIAKEIGNGFVVEMSDVNLI